MPLSAPAPRQHYHTRRIECFGYAREDGLWDIEAHMTDSKTYAFDNRWRGEVKPGTPVHDMWLRVTFDDQYKIIAIEAVTDQSPFEICAAIAPNFKKLIGLAIAPGWKRKVRELVGGSHGCTHLFELLGPLATVAYQTIGTGRKRRDQTVEADETGSGLPGQKTGRPAILGTCHAWAVDSPVVKEFMPDYYTPKKD
jgi:hypothetical protein